MASRQATPPPAVQSAVRPTEPLPAKEQSVIEQAMTLRATLRDLLGQVNHLVQAIKRQKKQEKFLRSTLASLKELQSMA